MLGTLGQSIWLDYIRRDLIASGGLRRLIEEDGLRGMTSNPSIFGKAIADNLAALRLMFNAGAEAVDFGLPPVLPGTQWHLAVDTSHEAPEDLFAAGGEPLWENPHTYHLSPRSSAILLARCTAVTEAK